MPSRPVRVGSISSSSILQNALARDMKEDERRRIAFKFGHYDADKPFVVHVLRVRKAPSVVHQQHFLRDGQVRPRIL